MITIYTTVINHCKSAGLPQPSKKDIEHISRMSAHHFKQFWALEVYQLKEGSLLSDSGFMYVRENGSNYIVNAYPSAFLNEIIVIIERFYANKNKPNNHVKNTSEPKKIRKRIPVKVASSKNYTNK